MHTANHESVRAHEVCPVTSLPYSAKTNTERPNYEAGVTQ